MNYNYIWKFELIVIIITIKATYSLFFLFIGVICYVI